MSKNGFSNIEFKSFKWYFSDTFRLENLMFKRVFKLFQIARKLSTSGAIDTINEIHVLPTSLKIFFDLVSLGSSSNLNNQQLKPGDKLCVALQGMGTTFIKIGQFLATRPDIIGDELARSLEKLQDKVPAFDLHDAKKIIKKEIGENFYKDITEISGTLNPRSSFVFS